MFYSCEIHVKSIYTQAHKNDKGRRSTRGEDQWGWVEMGNVVNMNKAQWYTLHTCGEARKACCLDVTTHFFLRKNDSDGAICKAELQVVWGGKLEQFNLVRQNVCTCDGDGIGHAAIQGWDKLPSQTPFYKQSCYRITAHNAMVLVKHEFLFIWYFVSKPEYRPEPRDLENWKEWATFPSFHARSHVN